jgi:Domain of unknown function (DUF4136)
VSSVRPPFRGRDITREPRYVTAAAAGGVTMTRRAAALAIALTISAATLAAQDVKIDWDKTTNFTWYETYAWEPGVMLTGNTLVDQRIVNAVDAQLHAKGMRCGETGDLTLAAHLATKDRAMLNGFYAPWERNSNWGGVGTTGIVDELTQGTLIVDILDTRTGRLVWRGTATSSVSNDPAKNEKKISKAVEKMFKAFPPSATGTR